MLGVGIGINRRPLGAANYAKQLAKAYEARVIADGGVVESLGCFTAFAEALGAYQPPIALAATGIGEISFTANWKPFKDAKYYLLDVSTSPTFSTFVYENEIVPAPTTSYVVIGLNSNTTYYYRVRASTTFDADYQAVLDYATTQGYTLPSAGQQVLQNQLVVDLKAGGIWSKLDTFAVFATDGDSDFALIDWKRLAQNTAVNSPTFTTNQGFTTNGTSSVIAITYNPSTSATNYLLNDASYGVYKFGGSGSRGVRQVGLNAGMNFTSTGAGWTGINTNNPQTWTNAFSDNNNFKSIHRTANNITSSYENSTFMETVATLSTSRPTSFEIGRDAFIFSSWTCSLFFAGSSLTSEISDFSNAVNSYMTSI